MTFCIVIMCLGVIGNVMVPIVILKTKDMRNSTNIFLVNLSIADLMVLLVCTPTVLVEVNSKPETWVLGKELCLAVPFVELTVAHASVLTILAISFERYYAICEPLRAGYVCTKTRATLICALAWFFAALFTSPILAIAEHHTVTRQDGTISSQCLTQAVTFWPITFYTMVIILLYFIPLLMLIVLYSIIAKNLITAASKVVMNKTVDPYNTRARKQNSSERTQNRRVQRTVTNASTTSSSLSRTTNSLKKFFHHRSSLDRSDNETESKESRDDSNRAKTNGFYRMFTNKRFVRQQSAPVCPSPKLNKISRMRSEGNVLEVSDNSEVDHKIRRSYPKDVVTKFIGHSNVSGKNNRADIELDSSNRCHGSLRRSVLINSAKAKSLEGDSNKKFVSYQKIRVDCVVGFQKSRSIDYDFPESFV
ncbi:unnamed protein product [Parnassius apollo]|uniref:(apollo) hypothetical protein n=1 Tax=Parnassius apollo TaxID=110799 RepID=A0A8S3XAI5_PARAO|nr:unnamed protein product [Parnassius apollo]